MTTPQERQPTLPNGLELSCPAEAGNSPLLYGSLAGQASSNQAPARRVSFSELLGGAYLRLSHSPERDDSYHFEAT
jgi:hypothetical protein